MIYLYVFNLFKLWNDKHRFELVEEALKNTLNDLCLSYVDLYLIHWPFGTSVNNVLKIYIKLKNQNLFTYNIIIIFYILGRS